MVRRVLSWHSGGTLELLGGENWRKLDEKTKAARLETKCFLAEGASHNVHRDKSDLVNAAITSFLGV